MGRKRQSAVEDIIEITSMLPWWVGVVLAAFAYVGLHQVAVMEVVVPTNGVGMGHFVGKQMYKTFAMYLQYILPGLFLIGAAVSAFKRRKRKALHGEVAVAGMKGVLEAISWKQFEQLVGEHFRRRGFTVQENETGGADGGVDLVLGRGEDRYFVQCKQWKARQVGVATVRELYGVMAAKGAAGGYVVTSGVFTDEAKRFAEGREIQLIDGEQLVAVIRAQSTPHPGPLPQGERETSSNLDPGSLSGKTILEDTPSCPECSSPIVLRTARKGSNAGNSFWGCSAFPKCRGTRPA